MPWVTLWVPEACSLVAHCYTDLFRKALECMHGKSNWSRDLVQKLDFGKVSPMLDPYFYSNLFMNGILVINE